MLVAITPIAALLLSVALLLTGSGLQGTLLPVRASMEAFGTVSIGVLGASYYAGFVLGCLITPPLIRRVGHIRLFTAMVAVASVTPLAHALAVSPVLWWLFRALTGLCLASLYLIIESWLNERATSSNRGLIFSTYTTVNFTVITVGQMLVLTDDPGRYPLYAIASILVSLAAVPVAMTRAQQPVPMDTPRLSLFSLFRISGVGAMGCIAVGLTNGSFWALAPAFVIESGFGTEDVALFMSATVIGAALSQWPFGRLSDRMDRRFTILLASAGASGAGIGLVLAELTAPNLIVTAGFLFGIFSFPIYALSVAHANDHASSNDFVALAGGLLLLSGIASVIGPLLASLLISGVGPVGLFGFTAAVHAVLAVYTLHRMRQRAAPAGDQKATFVSMPPTAPIRSDIDPRAQDNMPAPVGGEEPPPKRDAA